MLPRCLCSFGTAPTKMHHKFHYVMISDFYINRRPTFKRLNPILPLHLGNADAEVGVPLLVAQGLGG